MGTLQHTGLRQVVRECITGGVAMFRQFSRQRNIGKNISDPGSKTGMSKSFFQHRKKYV